MCVYIYIFLMTHLHIYMISSRVLLHEYLLMMIIMASSSSSWLMGTKCSSSGTSTTLAAVFSVAEYGAMPDGRTDATQAFRKAWASACSTVTSSAVVYVPKGRYLMMGSSEFRGPCTSKIEVQIEGTLVAAADHPMEEYIYSNHGSSAAGYWILFTGVKQLSVVGVGGALLDAKGAGFWACKKHTSAAGTGLTKSCPTTVIGARSMTLNGVEDGEIRGLASLNSQTAHLVINSCNNVRVSNVTMIAPAWSPNTDGIHVQSSAGVTITNAIIHTGDDCISIGPGTSHLWMDRIHCGPGHGISIGSLGRDLEEEGVQNVTLTNSIFTGSDNGLRIKTWARPSTGFVSNVSYRNIVMRKVHNPIIIDQNYCPNDNNWGCPNQSSGIKINRVSYQNIVGTSATQVAMAFDCSPINPCRGIKLKDIKLTYLGTSEARSSCRNTAAFTSAGTIMPNNCLINQ